MNEEYIILAPCLDNAHTKSLVRALKILGESNNDPFNRPKNDIRPLIEAVIYLLEKENDNER